MSDKQDNADLLRRARELRDKAASSLNQSDAKSSSSSNNSNRRQNWFKKFSSFLSTVNKYLGPLGTLVAWLTGYLRKWFRWAVYPPVESRADASNERTVSSKRLMWTLPTTLALVIGLHATWSAFYYYTTAFEETVYVTGKQEIVTGELYQFGGCISLPCSTIRNSGKFYLVEASLYFPMLYYPEEDVFANIPQQNGACQVEGYGIYFRWLRFLYKSLQLYQHVSAVSCRPYTAEEVRRAVDTGAPID